MGRAHRAPRRSFRSAFTLLELLIVIAIIGILLAAIAVAVTKAKEFANHSDQKANMKNIVTACLIAENANGNRLPPAKGLYGQSVFNPADNTNAQRSAGLFTHLLPYLENKPLFDGIVTKNAGAKQVVVRVYQSLLDPSLPSADPTNTNTFRYISFAANIRVFSTFASYQGYNIPLTMTAIPADDGGVVGTDGQRDGASNVIFLGTKYALCNGISNFFHEGPTSNSTTGSPPHRGPYFGAGPYDPALLPSSQVGSTNPPYQIAPSLGTTGVNVCNNTIGLYGHSFGNMPMAAAMGDTSVRNLSFTITGETFMRAMCPSDGNPLGNDW